MYERIEQLLDQLFGDAGCIWAKTQTLKSMCPIFLEEAHELIEAIDTDSRDQIGEELGDFIYNALFLLRVAEREGIVECSEILEALADKLERRHVHVFGDQPVSSMEELGALYEGIKRSEKKERTSLTEGIPKSLGALARAQKIIDRYSRGADLPSAEGFESESELEEELIHLVLRAHKAGLDPETQLHRLIGRLGDRFFIPSEVK